MMKHIMHMISGDLWAGAESQAYTFLKALYRTKKYNLTVVVFNEGELFERLAHEGIPTHLIDERRCNTVQMLWRMVRLIRHAKPDAIHTHEYKSNILAVCSNIITGRRARVIRTLHGLEHAPRNIRYLKSHIALWIDNIVLSHFTDCIIAVSRFLEGQLHRRYPGTLVRHINNAVDMPKPPVDFSQSIRSSFGISPDTVWIATAARLVPVKNIGMLIDAFKAFKGMNNRKVRLTIFGDGPLKKSLQDRVRKHGLDDIVYFYGYHDDITSIMHAWDVFALTSESEGLPMSLIEAMSVGVIPVCTRVGGMPEVIEDGVNGFLVESLNSQELAGKILRICEYDPERIGYLKSNARKTVMERYSIQASLEKLMFLYDA